MRDGLQKGRGDCTACSTGDWPCGPVPIFRFLMRGQNGDRHLRRQSPPFDQCFKPLHPISRLNCAPLTWILSTFSYACFCAILTLSPSPTTHSTRPPLVCRVPPTWAVPAWKVTHSCVSAGMPSMTSPLRGLSG